MNGAGERKDADAEKRADEEQRADAAEKETETAEKVQRFHEHRRTISKSDVAVVFVNTKRITVRNESLQEFRESTGDYLFAPFVPTQRLLLRKEDAICYVLKQEEDDFEPFYCSNNTPKKATMHYRVDFEILLRRLLSLDYKYVMKPVCVNK